MKPTEEFLFVDEHFASLVAKLTPRDLAAYHRTFHVRVETAFAGRYFIVYEMQGDTPVELNRIIVKDFHCTDEEGASAQVELASTGQSMVVGYQPVKAWDYPFFLFLPLHSLLRWGKPPDSDKGSLGFPILIRTQMRKSLRSQGVIYCETGGRFGKEFNKKQG